MKTIEIKDTKIINLLNEKQVLIDEGRAITKQIEALEQERHKVGVKTQKVKDKVIPLLKKAIADYADPYAGSIESKIKDGIAVVEIQSEDEFMEQMKLERRKDMDELLNQSKETGEIIP